MVGQSSALCHAKVITPSVWGEDAWRVMHSVALGYPHNPYEKDKAKYRAFYESLANVLPCSKCRDGYFETMQMIPIDLTGPDELFMWTVKIHNSVNRKLGHDIMDPQWVRNVYIFREHESCPMCSGDPDTSNPVKQYPPVIMQTLAFVCFVIIIILLAIIFLRPMLH